MLQVDGNVSPATQADIACWLVRRSAADRSGTFDANDFGAEVAQQHGGKRSGSDSGNFDDAESGEWSRHWFLSSVGFEFSGFRVQWAAVRVCPPMASAKTGASGTGKSWPMSETSR